MESNNWIIVKEVSSSNIVGVTEFVSELRQDYHVQYHKRWLPAACEGTELWISVFSNYSLESFLISSVLGGLTFDILKQFAFLPLIRALKKLYEKNEGNVNLQALDLEFDDIKVRIDDLDSMAISTVSSVFQEIVKVIPFLHSRDVTDIVEIRLPVMLYKYFSEEEIPSTMREEDESVFLWRVDYNNGCSRLIIDVKNKEISYLY